VEVGIEILTLRWLEQMGQTDALINARRMTGPGWVCIANGTPVAAAGLGKIGGGAFFAWVLLTEAAKSSPLLMRKLTREVRTKFAVVRDLVNAETIEAEAVDEPKYCRWLEMLGFNRKPVARYEWVRHG
jgi:hypothetical protein